MSISHRLVYLFTLHLILLGSATSVAQGNGVVPECTSPMVAVDGTVGGCVSADPRVDPFINSDLTRPSINLDRERFRSEDTTGQALAMIKPVRLSHLLDREVTVTGADGTVYQSSLPTSANGTYAIEYWPRLLSTQSYDISLFEEALKPGTGNRNNLLKAPFDGTREYWQSLVTPAVTPAVAAAVNGDIEITDNNGATHEGLSLLVDIGAGAAGTERFVTAQISVPKAAAVPESYPGLILKLDGRRKLVGIDTVNGLAEPYHSVHIPYDWGVIDDLDYWTVWVTARTESLTGTAELEVFAATRAGDEGWVWTSNAVGTLAFRNPVVYLGKHQGNATTRNRLIRYDDIDQWSALVTPLVEQFADGRFDITDNNTGTHEGMSQTASLSGHQTFITGQVQDIYGTWLESALNFRQRLASFQCSREQNPSMTHFINAYQYSHDPALLPTLRHLADSCMERVDIAGLGGVEDVDLLLWHPLWISRYHEQTRVEGDIARIQLLAESLDSRSVYHSNSMALTALAYDLGSDATTLSMTTSAGSFPCEIAKRVGDYELSGDVEPRFWKHEDLGLGGGLPHRAGSQLDMA